ncbi:unnamed protein product [Parnassius apollo]|uniref:(apollo) hypothetical protein n=1 Tax=Parnassius apollo TaxID=110799 RepID=A0A8S3XCJ6_PARAO|nr:unnamed protein product [Parnassius apollo]
MRYTILVIAVLSTLMVLGACQSDDEMAAMLQAITSNEPQQKTTTDEELNLDPVLDQTDTFSSQGSTSEITRSKGTISECINQEGQRGVCVYYYLCDQESKTIIEDGRTLIDVRSGEYCQKFLEICCLRSQVLEEPAKYESKQTKLVEKVVRSDEKPKANECGWSNPGVNVFTPRSGGERITDGEKIYADFGDFPWIVALLKRKQAEEEWEKSNYIGGGSLIHPSVVMTTAHKVAGRKPEDLKIRAGEWDTTSLDEEYEHQERTVSKIVIHRDYFRPSLYNDIALLFLEEPVNLTYAPHIGIGCLGKQMPSANTNCFSMGWGADNFNNKSVFAAVLKKVKLPLVEHSRCEEMLQKTRLGRIFRLHASLTCAGGQAGIDTCKGDGGSPLVCPIGVGGTRFAIFGMVAYGVGKCGQTDIPGVYVNVPDLYDWVEQQLYTQGYDTQSYVY